MHSGTLAIETILEYHVLTGTWALLVFLTGCPSAVIVSGTDGSGCKCVVYVFRQSSGQNRWMPSKLHGLTLIYSYDFEHFEHLYMLMEYWVLSVEPLWVDWLFQHYYIGSKL